MADSNNGTAAEALVGGRIVKGTIAAAAPEQRPAVQIDRPEWYCFPNGVMVSDITDYIEDFNLGNAVKYACRAGRKPGADVMDDLHKAKWYIERRIKVLREEAERNAASPAPVPEQAAEAAEQPADGMTAEGAVAIGEAFADLCGMPEDRRRRLVASFDNVAPMLTFRWKGKPVKIAGIKNPFHATLTTSEPGFYGVAWHDVNEVYQGHKTFDQCNIWLVSNAWLGGEGGK